jgi:curved DNA-binding protein CbpA
MAPRTLDPYAVLGLAPDASAEQVARAHRRLAKRYHPDLNPGAEATERMRRLNAARQILSSPGRRARYDSANPPTAGGQAGRGTAARRDEWPPRATKATWWTTAAPAGVSPDPWSAWQQTEGRTERSRRATRAEAGDDAFGAAGCALLLVAAALLFLLIRSPLW